MDRPRKLPGPTVLGVAPLDITPPIAASIIFPNLRVVKIMSKICPKVTLRSDLAPF
jgi:hypothetical protein